MNLAEYQKSLVIWDVFQSQMKEVKVRLADVDVVLIPVSVDMAHILQLVDLTVNASAKTLM